MSTIAKNKSILKQREFKKAVKPSEAFSFYWYITGLLHSKGFSEGDSEALRRYRSMGFNLRLHEIGVIAL